MSEYHHPSILGRDNVFISGSKQVQLRSSIW